MPPAAAVTSTTSSRAEPADVEDRHRVRPVPIIATAASSASAVGEGVQGSTSRTASSA